MYKSGINLFSNFISLLFFILIKLLFVTTGFSQQNERIVDSCKVGLFKYSEKIYGLSRVLWNGQFYNRTHNNAEGNPYFNDKQAKNGQLFVKGQGFKDLELKYNLEIDRLILCARLNNSHRREILLNDALIDSFFIGKRLFVNSSKVLQKSTFTGYIEQIYKGDVILFRKYNKTFVNSFGNLHPYGFYSKQNSILYIYSKGRFVRVNKKFAFLSFYIEIKKELRKYMRKSKMRYKKASNKDLFELMKFSDDRLLQKK